MNEDAGPSRLSAVSTMWTILKQAHAGPPDQAALARELLLSRYGNAVRRYLQGLLKDPHAADDLTQEFAVRLVTGKFHTADPEKGRFRNYVKTSLFHLIGAHVRGGRRRPEPVAPDAGALAGLAAPAADEPAFDESWRAELLARTWTALSDANPGYHQLLRLRADEPEASSDRLAEALSVRTGKPVTAANVRQTLKRARELFASLLKEEVVHSLTDPTADAVDAELADLRLLHYVRGG